MVNKNIIIGILVGLHARPASVFSKTAKRFASDVKVKYKEKIVNGKSAIHIITLNAKYGAEVEIIVDGTDEDEALEALTQILKNDME
jgi:phosphotransferase system HPr (HPr) family protein